MKPKNKEEAEALIRKIIGPPRRELEGDEYNKIWTLLKLIDPVSESNNQRSITETYYIGKQKYDVHYGWSDNPVIEEIDED